MVLRSLHPKQKFPLWPLHKPHIESQSKEPEPDHVGNEIKMGLFLFLVCPHHLTTTLPDISPREMRNALLHGSVCVQTLLSLQPAVGHTMRRNDFQKCYSFDSIQFSTQSLATGYSEICFGGYATLQPTVKTNHLILYKCFWLDVQW